MREWKPWDWIGYSTLGFSAFFIALEEGVKRVSTPDFLSSLDLSYLPFGLFCIGSLILFCRAMNWIGGNPQLQSPPQQSSDIGGAPFIATENDKVSCTYNDKSITFISNNYNDSSRTKRKRFTDSMKDYLRLGVESPLAVPPQARLKITPDNLEVLDADNIESVNQTINPDGSKLLAIHFYRVIENPHLEVAQSTTSAISVTSNTAVVSVRPVVRVVAQPRSN